MFGFGNKKQEIPLDVDLTDNVRNIIPTVKVGDLVKVILKNGESVTRSVVYKGYDAISLSKFNPYSEMKKDWLTVKWESIDTIEVIDRNVNQRHPNLARGWLTKRDTKYPFRWTRIGGQITNQAEIFELVRINETRNGAIHSYTGYIVALSASAVYLHSDDPLEGLYLSKIEKHFYDVLSNDWARLKISPLLDIQLLRDLDSKKVNKGFNPETMASKSQENFEPDGTHVIPKLKKTGGNNEKK